MNAHAMTAYGLWPLVALNAGLVILFAASFFKPRTVCEVLPISRTQSSKAPRAASAPS